MGKSYFQDFKDELKDEAEKFDAHAEKKKIKFKKCDHRGAKVEKNILRCPKCNAFWQGSGISKLERELNKEVD